MPLQLRSRARLPLTSFVCLMSLAGCGTSTDSTRPKILGVFTEDTTITDIGGVIVNALAPGAAAETAGVQANDVLGKMDGLVIVDVADLRSKIAAKTLGQTAHFDYYRQSTGEVNGIDVPIGPDANGSLANVLGFSVTGGTSFLTVFSIVTGSVAQKGNLKVNDQITSVNGSPTASLADAFRLLAPLTTDSVATLQYFRPGVPNINSQGVDIGYSLQLKAGSDAATSIPVPGLFVQNLTPALAAHFAYITDTGAGITTIYRDTPAFGANLLVGDIIFGFTPLDAGLPEIDVTGANVLTSLVEKYNGQNVQLRYLRGEQPPAKVEVLLSGVPKSAVPAPTIGMTFVPADPLPGLRVETIVTGGPAEKAGIAIDDRITIVNDSTVNTIDEFWSALFTEFDNDVLNSVLQVIPSSGSPKFVVLTLTAVE